MSETDRIRQRCHGMYAWGCRSPVECSHSLDGPACLGKKGTKVPILAGHLGTTMVGVAMY